MNMINYFIIIILIFSINLVITFSFFKDSYQLQPLNNNYALKAFSNGSILSNTGDSPTETLPNGYDRFGIVKVYPSYNGSEWYFNNSNPFADPSLSITGNDYLQQEKDGFWTVGGQEVKLNIDSDGILKNEGWKNVEMTGYIKVLDIFNQKENITRHDLNTSSNGILNKSRDFDISLENTYTDNKSDTGYDINWLARGGRHSNDLPCEGTSIIGILHADGSTGWKKEIWHTGGYSDEREKVNATSNLLGRWIGWKVIMYNIDNDTKVVMESYIDDNNINQWKMVSKVVDNGGWYASSSNDEFERGKCNRPKDYVILNGGPIASFRFDNLLLSFKYLSIREISSN